MKMEVNKKVGCSSALITTERKIEDIESFLYDRMDDFSKKENNINLVDKEKDTIRSMVSEFVKMNFDDEIIYERKNNNIETKYFYIILFSFIMIFMINIWCMIFKNIYFVSIFIIYPNILQKLMQEFRYEKKIINNF